MKNYRLYDNCGKTFDRYTLVIDGEGVYSLSNNALSPQGVNSFVCTIEDLAPIDQSKDIPIELEDLPLEVYEAVMHMENKERRERGMPQITIHFGKERTFTQTKEFNNEAELNAYLEGLADMDGWLEYEIEEDEND